MKKNKYQYGYDINTIHKQIYRPKPLKTKYGYLYKVIENSCYGLSYVFMRKGGVFLFNPPKMKDTAVYLEEGKLKTLKPKESFLISKGASKKSLKLEAEKDSFLYIFFGPGGKAKFFKKSGLFNFHNQPWADLVWTMFNGEYAAKRIFFKKGNNSSFHFHCQKSETYFVHSGKLLLRLRAGKGEDRFFALKPGQAVDIPPGLMHQAGGLGDTTIMEVSTPDSDKDAFLIESEFTKMLKLKLK